MTHYVDRQHALTRWALWTRNTQLDIWIVYPWVSGFDICGQLDFPLNTQRVAKVNLIISIMLQGPSLCIHTCMNRYRQPSIQTNLFMKKWHGTISLLSSLSKIVEKIIHIQLYDYFDRNCVLKEIQYDFSTNYTTGLGLLYLSKVFNTLNHWITS